MYTTERSAEATEWLAKKRKREAATKSRSQARHIVGTDLGSESDDASDEEDGGLRPLGVVPTKPAQTSSRAMVVGGASVAIGTAGGGEVIDAHIH